MSNNLLFGLTIGASLSSGYYSAVSGAKSTLDKLGSTATQLGTQHAKLGSAMSQAMAKPNSNIKALHRQYTRLGESLQKVQREQRKLNELMAKQRTLGEQRQGYHSKIKETLLLGTVVGAPVIKSVIDSSRFQDQIKDISITAEFNAQEESIVSSTVRQNAVAFNQTTASINQGLGVLVAGGINNAKELEKYTPTLAKAATATRASMDDLGQLAIAMNNSLGIASDGFERSLNMLAYAGKEGQFELADMAKWVPTLAPSFASLGITGEKAIAQMGAALQVARMGAGTNDEAANNFANFLGKLTSPDTKKAFEDAGIDIESSIKELVSKGMTAPDAMIGVVQQYIGSKGPGAGEAYQKALSIQDESERTAAIDNLSQAYKLGELFRDRQVLNFLRPALQNTDALKSIEIGSFAAADKGILDSDFNKRMESPVEQFQSFKIMMSDISMTIGDALVPALISAWESMKPIVVTIGEFLKNNPEIIKWGIGLIAGALALKTFGLGAAYVINLGKSFIGFIRISGAVFSSIKSIMGASAALGKLSGLAGFTKSLGVIGGGLATKAVGALKLFGHAILWIGRSILLTPVGAIIGVIAATAYVVYRYWEPIKAFFSKLWSGVKNIFANTWVAIKRIFSTGVSAIVYRYWEPIKAFFSKLWSGVKNIFANTWVAIKRIFSTGVSAIKTVFSWSPLGLVINNWGTIKNYAKELWDSVKSYFGAGIGALKEVILGWSPIQSFKTSMNDALSWFKGLSDKFAGFGKDMMHGLVNGIKNMGGAVKEAISGVGESTVGWFKEKLGINSPSRVFAGLGHGIGEGVALGVGRSSRLAINAVDALGQQSLMSFKQHQNKGDLALISERLSTQPSAAMTTPSLSGSEAQRTMITFNPQITINAAGDKKSIRAEAEQALKLSLREFERLYKRMTANKSRVSYSEV
ncbi:phage tail tape measure protein [Oligella urethralis]|uniref:phage tail tape measure protein n=1 Tax=Oligella urethralis TaxID=90245 RepID=UPI000DFB3C93|nr:phage tail tape measure protein [Oligella urethralis]SUA58120.1 Phage-related protein [Oligella urethralis]